MRPVICPRLVVCVLALVGLAAGGVIAVLCWSVWRQEMLSERPVVPVNLNIGGWLLLEAWMFSGEIGTQWDTLNQGICFPPAVLHEPWPSEGVLVQQMLSSLGNDRTIEQFRLHRETFITTEDLDDIVSLGVQVIRVPFMWTAFADALIRIDRNVYGGFDPELETTVIPDPFYYQNASYVTIPRNILAQFLRNCSERGLKVLLDLHAYPSGSANGSYNGIVPLDAVFWSQHARIGNTSVALTDAGLWIVDKFIRWIEDLGPAARSSVEGISLMNEPGNDISNIAFHSQKMLDWMAQAADIFRASTLPGRGVKLYVNLIQNSIPNFYVAASTWWRGTFSEAERSLWAVFDMHNYLAWSATCKGHHADVDEPGWSCQDPLDHIRRLVDNCIGPFLEELAWMFGNLRAIGEFSLATHGYEAFACSNHEVLDMLLAEQLLIFRKYAYQPFFWSWKMPYSPTKEPGWSYQYHVGLSKTPPFQCHPPQSSALDSMEHR